MTEERAGKILGLVTCIGMLAITWAAMEVLRFIGANDGEAILGGIGAFFAAVVVVGKAESVKEGRN